MQLLEPLSRGYTSASTAAALQEAFPRALFIAASLAGDAHTFVLLSNFSRQGSLEVEFITAEKGTCASLRICHATTVTIAMEDCTDSKEEELAMFYKRIKCQHVLTATIANISGGCCQGVLFIGLPDAIPTEQEKLEALKTATQFAASLSTQPPRLLQQLRVRSLLGMPRCPICQSTHGKDATWFRNNSWTAAANTEAQRGMVRANPAAGLGTRSSSGSMHGARIPSSGSMGGCNGMASPFQMREPVGNSTQSSPGLEAVGPGGGIYQTVSLDCCRSSKMRRGSMQYAGFGRQGSVTSTSSLGKRCYEDPVLQAVGPASGPMVGGRGPWRSKSSQPAYQRIPTPPNAIPPTSTPFIMDDTRNAMPVTKMRRNSMPVDAMYMDMAQQHALRSSMMSAAQQQQYMMAAQEQQQQYMMAAQQQQYMMAQQQYMMGRQQEVPLGDWLQGQFQSDPTTMPDVTATPLVMTAVDAVDKTGNISHAAGMGSATSSTETNTPQYLPGEEAVAPAWSPFAAAQMPKLPATPDTVLLPLLAPLTSPAFVGHQSVTITGTGRQPKQPIPPMSNAAAELAASETPLAWDPATPLTDDGLLDMDDLKVLAALAEEPSFGEYAGMM